MASYIRLQANSNPVSFWLLLQIATFPGLADGIRKSITAAFDSNGKVIDVELLVNDPPPPFNFQRNSPNILLFDVYPACDGRHHHI